MSILTTNDLLRRKKGKRWTHAVARPKVENARLCAGRVDGEEVAGEEFVEVLEGSEPFVYLVLALDLNLSIALIPVVGIRQLLVFLVVSRHGVECWLLFVTG